MAVIGQRGSALSINSPVVCKLQTQVYYVAKNLESEIRRATITVPP